VQKLSRLENRPALLGRKVNRINMLPVIGKLINAAANYLRDCHSINVVSAWLPGTRQRSIPPSGSKSATFLWQLADDSGRTKWHFILA